MWKWLPWCISLLVILEACSSTNQPNPTASIPTGGMEADVRFKWEKAVAEAKREGRVVISGPTREVWRTVLTSFEQEFPGIKVEYTGVNSRDFWPRVFRERELGQYLWDLRIGGPEPQVYEAKNRGVLDPVRPLLLLPEVADEKIWFGGTEKMFFDRDKKYVLGFVNYITFVAYVNRDVIPETELRSVKDLTQPRWKGKMVIQDPRGGAGLTAMGSLLEIYGEEGLKDFLKNQTLVQANDQRQQAEWLIRGRYPIAIGITPDAFLVFQDQGLKLNIQPIEDSGIAISTGTGGIQLFNRAANPNAAQVFINWLLTKEVQTRLSAVTRQNSRRLDVPIAHPETAPDPSRIASYTISQAEEILPLRQRALEVTSEFLH